MPHLIAVCRGCSAVRYRTKVSIDDPNHKLKAEDFEPVGDQPPGIDGEPVTCVKCGGSLTFGKEPSSQAIPPQGPVIGGTPEERMARMREQRQAARPSGVTTLFSVEPNETISKLDEIAPMRYFVVTSKRILIVDANEMLGISNE